MPSLSVPQAQTPVAPRFYLTPPQRLGPRSILPALVLATAFLFAVRIALSHTHHGKLFGAGSSATDDSSDDPSQMDTIYLGGPDQAPTATRPTAGYNPVHPFKVVRLPRSGDGTGQIPDSPAGHALYTWLAAFNNKDPSLAANALPMLRSPEAQAAQVELRRQTGGFTLISAREVEPDLIVFRLHDQTTAETEVLGTLRLRSGTTPPSIGSFSLRALP